MDVSFWRYNRNIYIGLSRILSLCQRTKKDDGGCGEDGGEVVDKTNVFQSLPPVNACEISEEGAVVVCPKEDVLPFMLLVQKVLCGQGGENYGRGRRAYMSYSCIFPHTIPSMAVFKKRLQVVKYI